MWKQGYGKRRKLFRSPQLLNSLFRCFSAALIIRATVVSKRGRCHENQATEVFKGIQSLVADRDRLPRSDGHRPDSCHRFRGELIPNRGQEHPIFFRRRGRRTSGGNHLGELRGGFAGLRRLNHNRCFDCDQRHYRRGMLNACAGLPDQRGKTIGSHFRPKLKSK